VLDGFHLRQAILRDAGADENNRKTPGQAIRDGSNAFARLLRRIANYIGVIFNRLIILACSDRTWGSFSFLYTTVD